MPLPHGGGKPASLSAQVRQKVRRKVRQQSDISLAELRSFLLAEEQTSVRLATISRADRTAWQTDVEHPVVTRVATNWRDIGGSSSRHAPDDFVHMVGHIQYHVGRWGKRIAFTNRQCRLDLIEVESGATMEFDLRDALLRILPESNRDK